MLTIDGSMGEGGGQVLRSALALSMCLNRPFRILDIRAHRDRPGLLPQHLAAVRAAAEISGARVAGAEAGGRELTFEPGRIIPSDYKFSIGTAGSAILVLQTVLPALLTAEKSSRLTLEGGTHNPKAPSFDFLARAYLPLVTRMGPRIEMNLERHGFYPLGGGVLAVTVDPTPHLEPLRLEARGTMRRVWAEVLLSKLAHHIAEREMAIIRKGLDLSPDSVRLRVIEDSAGPGNVVTIFVESQRVCEVFTGYGKRGVPAETVARGAVRAASRYLESEAPVGPYLADQLLLPLAFAGGGSFVTVEPTRHTTTNIDLIGLFLPLSIDCGPTTSSQAWRIRVG